MFVRSFVYACIATVLALADRLPAGLRIAFKSGRWKNLLLVLVIAPFFTSFLLRTLAWKTILPTTASWSRDFLRFVHILLGLTAGIAATRSARWSSA